MVAEAIDQESVKNMGLLAPVKRGFVNVECDLVLAVTFVSILYCQPMMSSPGPPWKGYALLGNGHLCAVYSDDRRVCETTGLCGIQHLYYENYTVDYVASTSFEIADKGHVIRADSIGVEGGVRTVTRSYYPGGFLREVRCCVHPLDAVILTLNLKGARTPVTQRFRISLRRVLVTDTVTVLVSLVQQGDLAIATWSNGTFLVAALHTPGGSVDLQDSIVSITRRAADESRSEILIALSSSKEGATAIIGELRKERDPSSEAFSHWQKWLNNGKLPEVRNADRKARRYLDLYKRNLYAVKSSNIGGQIPADLTGQFITNNMPQLYPRDAMMCARVFLLTGHPEESREVIGFWTRPDIPKRSKGEYYARYDAHAKAVNAGSGARYDVPEWDANGYLIQLLHQYHEQTQEGLADKSIVYELADFLAGCPDSSGLLYEGGIVEWPGYLPATNMVCGAALKTAADIAKDSGDSTRAELYDNAAKRISSSLFRCYDRKRGTYTDVRYAGSTGTGGDTLYLWDTSTYFGILWGYPDHVHMRESDHFYESNVTASRGGMKYFEAKNNAGLSAYGGDLFFFTTAAAGQYHLLSGDTTGATDHIDWMVRNANCYGLMPERVYLNGSDCSPASPLSWCCAEFAAAICRLYTR